MLGGTGAAAIAGAQDRTVRRTRPLAAFLWIEHIATKASDRRLGRYPKHGRGLWVEIADAPLAIDRKHAFDDPGNDRLGFGLLAAQVSSKPQQMAPHLFEGGGQRADLGSGGRW